MSLNARQVIASNQAPKAIGPYSQAIVAGGQVWCSGQIAFDPASGKLLDGDVGVQTERALENLSAVLAQAGTGLLNALRCTVYLVDMQDFEAMNAAYARYFASDAPPARSTVAVAQLPRGARVEIDCVALLV